MKSINTVNVIEFADSGDLLRHVHIKSYPDTKEGNEAAEERFRRLINENYPMTSEEEIEDSIDNGYFESGNYIVIVSHAYAE